MHNPVSAWAGQTRPQTTRDCSLGNATLKIVVAVPIAIVSHEIIILEYNVAVCDA
jgi:hypothetical protein